jgi:hypothetical protein
MYEESDCRKMRPNIILKGNVPNYKNLVHLRKQYLTHPIPFLIHPPTFEVPSINSHTWHLFNLFLNLSVITNPPCQKLFSRVHTM